MHICFVTSWGFQHLDGSNLRTYFLLKELIARGHSVTVIHASDEDAQFTKNHFGCQATGVGITITRWDSMKNKLIKYITFIQRARKKTRTIECDVVFGISLLNNLVAVKMPRIPSVIMFVDFMSNYYSYVHPDGLKHKLFSRLLRYAEHYAMKKATKVITITRSILRYVPESCHEKTSVIPDGADTEKLKPASDTLSAKKAYSLKADDFVIGYQGGIEKYDGLQFLAHAAPGVITKIPQARFLIAGKGSYLEAIKIILRENGAIDRFLFLGWVKSEEIPRVMAATDLNVVPVPNHPATAPLITFRLVESMAAGINIIANDLPGMREIADDSMVFFTDVENRQRFSEDIIAIYKASREKKLEMASNARKKLESLDWRLIAKRDAEVIESVRA